MADPEIPRWLKSLPLAPEYRPTETEFADPIAFISRIEREASAFGICKVIPPFSKPSKKFVLSNLNRSLSKSPDLPSSSSPVFTTRHQELGSRKTRPPVYKQQVWQSGELYTLDQFEAKSKSFARAHLGSVKEVNPFLVESLFWKAASEKPIYIEYANDVPGSGFAVPEEPFRYYSHRRKRKRGFEPKCPLPASSSEEREGTAGWKLSNSPWNLQVIARSPGSLTRFMPDEVPGVTSPMVYIGMLFSWFAWHVEDHELHSLNFLHMGSSKTWYAVPGEYASTVEEIVRVQGYGGNLDRLEAFTMLGEKTTLLSPEVFVASGVPCCRLVQNPGEFVVTFPRAYHVGFSHGFNCGEAANFATPQWLKVAKEAAVRRAAMNYLPMLSHQQLLYMLTMSFVSRVPRALLSGVRSSRLKDRKREEREILVKKTFLNDMMNENNLLCVLLAKESSSYAVLWEPDLLPNACTGSQTFSSSISLEAQGSVVDDDQGRELIQCKLKDRSSFEDKTDNCFVENSLHEVTANLTSDPCHNIPSVEKHKNACHADCMSSDMELLEILDADEGDLPFGWKIDSGTLACVACGILGYPFMAIVQPSEKASKELFSVNCEESHQNLGKSGCSNLPSCLPNTGYKFGPEETDNKLGEQGNPDSSCKLSPVQSGHVPLFEGTGARDGFKLLNNDVKELSNQFDELNPKIGNNNFFSRNYTKVDYSNGLHPCDGLKEHRGSMNMKTNAAVEIDISGTSFPGTKPFSEIDRLLGAPVETSSDEINKKWTTSNGFNRPRIFCLQHALEIEELLHCKGGAHVLIICHSDYLKIKAYATSIAEEVGMQFNFKDVPLENASLSDLNLINITIDDEHEEHGEDWTSKLGVNLRYCVQLRKQSTSKQERLTLALGRIFSDPFPLSAVSTLKWLSRKSRTPCKVVGTSLAKLHIDENMEKGEPTDRNLIADIATKVQVYRSLRREPSHMASKHCGRLSKGIPREFGSSNEGAMVDGRDDHKRTSSHTHHLNEKVEDDNCGGLFTVPISAAEKLQMHQESWLPLKVSTSDEVTDPESSECCHPYINIPVLESPEMRQERHSAEDFGTKCKVRSSEKSESQANILEQEAKNSEFQRETRALDEINSEHAVHNTVESGSEPTSQGAVHYSEDLQDTSAAQESNLEGSLVNSLLSVDQSPVPVLSYKSEMQLEVSIAEEPKMEGNVENFSKSERVLVNNLLRVDSFGMQQEEIPAAEYNLQCEVGNLQLESQHSTIVPMVISSEVQQEIYSANETKTNDKLNYLKPVVDNSSVNSAHAIAVSMDESSGMQESVKDTLEGGGSYNGNINTVDVKQYVRRRNKRKREEEQIAEDHHFCNASFIRSPCEGLRPRTGRTATASEKADIRTVEKKKVVEKVTKRLDKDKCKESYECDIEGCCMSLKTRSELQLHKLNRCTHKGCGKRFRSHKHAMRHQRVHDNERPLKCPWKGCGMSFKWAWARTEHVRIHTGERPYKCTVAGCGLTFRFVSDFSRHRRKTGHSVNLTEQ